MTHHCAWTWPWKGCLLWGGSYLALKFPPGLAHSMSCPDTGTVLLCCHGSPADAQARALPGSHSCSPSRAGLALRSVELTSLQVLLGLSQAQGEREIHPKLGNCFKAEWSISWPFSALWTWPLLHDGKQCSCTPVLGTSIRKAFSVPSIAQC